MVIQPFPDFATTFAGSLLGRTMLRILASDPVRLTEQGLAARRQTFDYGHWEIVRRMSRPVGLSCTSIEPRQR